jgi:hypothetical protein
MRKPLIVGDALVLLVMAAAPVSAASELHLAGGGTASISQVAFNVSIEAGGAATGSFNCLMAGRSAFVLGAFNLSHLMKVQVHPDTAKVDHSIVTFSGPGFLIMDGRTQSIHVEVWTDVAAQQFKLTVDGIGSMPVETMQTGHFELQ